MDYLTIVECNNLLQTIARAHTEAGSTIEQFRNRATKQGTTNPVENSNTNPTTDERTI